MIEDMGRDDTAKRVVASNSRYVYRSHEKDPPYG
jgi:hypothetical protein